MLQESFSKDKRNLRSILLSADFVVVGGGISGICAAVSAARAGVKTILVQDRPVLGGNASSEVRLWILGATSHMGNNNRWSREGGLIDEILVDNLYRNKEGNPVLLDTLLLELKRHEQNITLLLNTAVYDVEKRSPDEISKIYGFCSQNYTFYEISGRLFCDASGDGIIAYRAGAAYRMGAEEKQGYGELFAPDKGEYGELLGHSIYFYSKDTGKPVKFVMRWKISKKFLDGIVLMQVNMDVNSGGLNMVGGWIPYMILKRLNGKYGRSFMASGII